MKPSKSTEVEVNHGPNSIFVVSYSYMKMYDVYDYIKVKIDY